MVLEAGKSKIKELVDLVFAEVLPGSSAGKESACNPGDPGSIPWLGRYAGEGIGYPLQYSWASLVAQLVKNPWVGKMPWRRGQLPTPVFWPGEFHDYIVRDSLESSPTPQFKTINSSALSFL